MKRSIQKGTINNFSYLSRVPGPRNSICHKRRKNRSRRLKQKLISILSRLMNHRNLIADTKSIYAIVGYSSGKFTGIKHIRLDEPNQLRILKELRVSCPTLIFVVYPDGEVAFEIVGHKFAERYFNTIDIDLILYLEHHGIYVDNWDDVKSVSIISAYKSSKTEVMVDCSPLDSIDQITNLKIEHPNCSMRVILSFFNGVTQAENIYPDKNYLNVANH